MWCATSPAARWRALDADEICDASPIALELTRQLGGNSEFYNLPRKFKVSITGCHLWCSYPEINDVALTATTRRRRGAIETGFSLRVAGGLSTEPHLAVRLNAFVLPHQAVQVVRGVAEIFRESEVLRQSRDRARLKFLFLNHGWTAESFLANCTCALDLRWIPRSPNKSRKTPIATMWVCTPRNSRDIPTSARLCCADESAPIN